MTKMNVILISVLFMLAAHTSLTQPDQPPPTATPRPTRTPLPTPEPLTAEVAASCPVSRPNLTEPAPEGFASIDSGYGNPERTIFTVLWPGGTILFHPSGPGFIDTDGSMSMKHPFYRTIPGEVVIEGRRLDEPGAVAHFATLSGPEDGYGETGFHPSGLHFPGQGCWEVTASIGDDSMTFVTLALWLPFKPLRGSWFPAASIDRNTDLTAYPQAIHYVYNYPDGGELRIATIQGAGEDLSAYPDSAKQQLTVRREDATCIQGVWSGEDWNADANASLLTWFEHRPNLSYRISQTGLNLSCEDLHRVLTG